MEKVVGGCDGADGPGVAAASRPARRSLPSGRTSWAVILVQARCRMFVFGCGALLVIYWPGGFPRSQSPTSDGRSRAAGRRQRYLLPNSCVCSSSREYFASWRVVDFCANRFLLSIRSTNEGATPWPRKQRKRKRRRRSSFELQ